VEYKNYKNNKKPNSYIQQENGGRLKITNMGEKTNNVNMG
jgi:hypothetical protein